MRFVYSAAWVLETSIEFYLVSRCKAKPEKSRSHKPKRNC